MDKGWGLTLDSDPIGLFANKPGNLSLTQRLGQNRGSMFPATLQRREEQASPSPSDGNRVVVGEVDFFSDKNKNKSSDDHNKDFRTSRISVKKENSYEVDPKSDLDVNTGLRLVTTANNSGSDQSTVEDGNEMAVLQAELQRMNAENQRLRGMLSQVSHNYSALQMHLITLTQQQQQQTASRAETTHEHEMVEGRSEDKKKGGGGPVVPRQFLELGPTAQTDDHQPSQSSSEERTPSVSLQNSKNDQATVLFDHQDKAKKVGREESPESEGWVPNKVPKLDPSSKSGGVDDQPTSAEATMRKARVSVRARSEAPMISDGCQWRKYGQKMAKGNPCPRAYYRCTMAVGCPVRKQVQRCAEDRTILITTYEGTHNHPLPPAAVAMASTTSAAANMLLSGSMSSADGLMNPNFLARTILPCSSSMATISASAPFPTVTLDLTHTPNPLHFQRPPTQFQVPFAAGTVAAPTPPQPPVPQIFGQALYNKSQFSGLQVSQNIEPAQVAQQAPLPSQHPSFADTLSAATAAITADPNFTAALAAAISSIIGGGGHSSSANNPATSNGNSFGSFQGNSK